MGRNQDIGKTAVLSGNLGNGSASKLIQAVGHIQFPVTVELTLVSCWLSARSQSLLLEVVQIPSSTFHAALF